MRRPTFLHGAIVAALFGLSASAFVAVLVPFVGPVTVARLVVPLLALVYVCYLVTRSGERAGRVVTLTLWSAMTVLTWWLVPSFALFLLIHAGAIWLIRSLYFYSGVFPALIDLGLNASSVVVALGTLARTGSVFLSVWSFFLVQALFVAIPRSISKRKKHDATANQEPFERSRRQAEAALKQLIAP